MSDRRSGATDLSLRYFAKKIADLRLTRPLVVGCATITLCSAVPATAASQRDSSAAASRQADTYWRHFALGFAGSIVAHEAAHVVASLALGAHPYVAFDKGRPTVFSGIDSETDPHRQFVFSAAGLTTQSLINELILDLPHAHGHSVERGLLAGGIATTLFYVTLGRNASVSDISLMARTSSLSKTQLSLIFGGVSVLQAWRISRDPRYANFFVRPSANSFTAGLTF